MALASGLRHHVAQVPQGLHIKIDKSHIPSLRDGDCGVGLAFSTNIPSLRDGLLRGNLLTGKHRRDGARPVSTLRRTTPPQTFFAETHAVRLYIAANIPLFWR
ncbi:MAG: hypothetical protein LBD59_06260, partial [Prevotellaceae bacterium]|nr:hypothetical protein [Prevotellaceae bacterium]